ncbi:MAG TPA: hypothetical protein ENN31_01445 [Candidatus Vogelbacteria bacterium]|nr:hypothetical protein [Candidatus Vogelbacteria bacterium]
MALNDALSFFGTEVLKKERWEKRRWPYYLILPLSFLIVLWVAVKKGICLVMYGCTPRMNSLFFDGLGRVCREIKEGAASWKALDLIYGYSSTGNLVDDFWVNMMNAQAVRNRLEMVKGYLMDSSLEVARDGQEVRIMSLACGSAQAVIEILVTLKQLGIPARAMLIDRDSTALDYAAKMARNRGIDVELVLASVSQVKKYSQDFQPQIIEMVGLMDYLSSQKAKELTQLIHTSLPEGGWYITANIISNIERWFLYWVINWQMVYRQPEELREIVDEVFGSPCCDLKLDPLGIHAVVIARK